MELTEINRMLRRNYLQEGKKSLYSYPPGDAQIRTGNPRNDAYLHYVEKEYGLDVILNENNTLTGYHVLDEKKFMWFVLRWL